MYGLFATSQQVNKAATRLCAIWLTCNKAVRHMAHLQQGCAPYGSLATRLCAIWLTCTRTCAIWLTYNKEQQNASHSHQAL